MAKSLTLFNNLHSTSRTSPISAFSSKRYIGFNSCFSMDRHFRFFPSSNYFNQSSFQFQKRNIGILGKLIKQDEKGKQLKRDFNRGMGLTELRESEKGYKPVPTQVITPQALPLLPNNGWEKLQTLNKQDANFYEVLKSNPDKFTLLIISDRRVITSKFVDQWRKEYANSPHVVVKELVIFEEVLFRFFRPAFAYLMKKTLPNPEDHSSMFLYSHYNLSEFRNEMLCLNVYIPYIYLIDSKARVHLVSSGAPARSDIKEIEKKVSSVLGISSLSQFSI